MKSVPGTTRTYPVAGETIPPEDDLRLAAPIEGRVRLMRTGRSIIAKADLDTALEAHCSRCLTEMSAPVHVTLEEEALPSIDFTTGRPIDTSDEPEALRLDEHHELDLVGPVRDAISLAEPIAPLCREDCAGLCVTCGVDLNTTPDHGHPEDEIDPRLAGLAEWQAGNGLH
jgi:uncharacterized protein